jgi:hypothetical protein
MTSCDYLDDNKERCPKPAVKWAVVHGIAGADFSFCAEHFKWFNEPEWLADYHGDIDRSEPVTVIPLEDLND